MDTGWIYGSSGRTIDQGCPDWLNPSNATGEQDGVTTYPNLAQNQQSDTINVYNYSMNVPADKQINGIAVNIRKAANGANAIKDYTLHMMDGTSCKGSDGGDSDVWWAGDFSWVEYGGAVDLWGAAWTVEQVNASTFGVGLRTKNYDAYSRRSYVDSMAIKIYYGDLPLSDYLMIMGM